MKKQDWILIGATGVFLILLLGVFLGKNFNDAHTTNNIQPIQTQPAQNNTPNLTAPININTADLQQLQQLPGIGEVLAQKIIDYREKYGDYANTENLINVLGINEATFEEIRDYITVD